MLRKPKVWSKEAERKGYQIKESLYPEKHTREDFPGLPYYVSVLTGAGYKRTCQIIVQNLSDYRRGSGVWKMLPIIGLEQ